MRSNTSKFQLISGGFTHVGMKRDHNEDAFIINPDGNLLIVADGMGGHNSGEIASKMAAETVNTFFMATAEDDEITWPYKYDKNQCEAENRLNVSIRLANDRVYETSKRNELYHGMGTTIVSVFFTGSDAYIANVGDSRVYVFRGSRLDQLTVDHSLLNDFLKENTLTPEEIENFPHKNVIVRALGIKEDVEVDVFHYQPKRDDIFLLCSDGLTDMVNDAEIADIILTTPDVKMGVKLLVREANQRGGMDNITAVLVQLK